MTRKNSRQSRLLSLALSLCIVILLAVSTLLYMGIEVGAATSNYGSELWLLHGSEYALIKGVKTKINNDSTASSYNLDVEGSGDTAYIPISAVCKYMGASWKKDGSSVTIKKADGSTATLTVGSSEWSGGVFYWPVVYTDGEPYITILSVGNIFGTKSYYDSELGLVILSTSTINTKELTLKNKLDVLGGILFERPSGETIYSDMVAHSGENTHPRLMATQQTFDNLRSIYENEFGENDFCADIYAQIAKAEGYFNGMFTLHPSGVVAWTSPKSQELVRQPHYLYDENGNRLVGFKEYTYTDENGEKITLTLDPVKTSGLGDGYDFGGRSYVDSQTKKLKSFAFAWQMTGEKKYADAFYLLAIELGKWEHWGEGHFLNVADGAVEFALGLDWIYHAFDDSPTKRDEMAKILYEKGMMKGYYSIKYDGKSGSYVSSNGYLSVSNKAGSTAWRTMNRDNNWQTVCGSGMTVSALYLMDYPEYRANAQYVVTNYTKALEKCLHQYAPDGAYIESPGYWGYGTNTLMVTLSSLDSACGKTYGYLDIIGLRDSYYFVAGIADSDIAMWNYHDSSEGMVSGTSFYYAARAYDDAGIAAYRDKAIKDKHLTLSIFDILFYDPGLSEGAEELPLDYNFLGIDTATFRSSWESGAIFTGLHTGPNHTTHGDMDCGNFILSMGGVRWVRDPGAENYNVNGFWNSGENGKRYKLYAKSLEGHSTVMIRNNTSIPRGQFYTTSSTDYATIDSFYSDALGGYAVTNMTKEYGSTCSSGYRGVLLTNSRSTVVLQDEISFSSPTDLSVVLNMAENPRISEDGRTIINQTYNTPTKEKVVLRVTLLSDNENIRFRKMGAYETVYSTTYTNTGNGDPLALDPLQRVVIEANGVTEYKVALVFEIIRHTDEVVGYSFTSMNDWATSDDEWVKEANKDIDYNDTPTATYRYKLSDFVRANNRLLAAGDDLTEIGKILRETYIYTTSYNRADLRTREEADKYLEAVLEYNLKIREVNQAFKSLCLGV